MLMLVGSTMKHNRWNSPAHIERYEIMPSGCWHYTGYKRKDGYGLVTFGQHRTGDRQRVLAHRYFYERLVGPIPEGMLVCHRCDNPSCVNPDHLFVGTHLDNNRDARQKDRSSRHGQKGVAHHKAKLTEDDVRSIRTASGTLAAIGAEFGISHAQVWLIRKGKAWTHVS
jgi:hypothetical protein